MNTLNLSATQLNINTKSKLFDETSVVFGLFIGYLIVDSKELKVEDYYSEPTAYLCIQGRGLGAMLGVWCLALSSLIRFSINSLLSVDIQPDTPEQEQRLYNLVFTFISRVKYIQLLTYFLSYISIFLFVSGYCLELYSLFHMQLGFDFFWFAIITGTILLVMFSFYIYYQKRIIYDRVLTLKSPL